MIVVDGRTDEEKLRELLNAGGECTELEFKETYDLSRRHDELEFVKDAVAMFNHYPGGYLVIGVTEDSKPSDDAYAIDWKQFDGAKLTDKIRKYVDAPLMVLSAQHEIDGHKYYLICCLSPKDGLPVPFSKLGQSDNSKPVFRPGDIVRRDGAQVRSLEYSQWPEILEPHDEIIRRQERERNNALIDRILLDLDKNSTGAGITPPLEFGMDEKSLKLSISSCLNHDNTNALILFIDQVNMNLGRSIDAPIILAGIAALAASYRADNIFDMAIDKLYRFYSSINCDIYTTIDNKLTVLSVLYAIGTTLVMGERWELISPLVNKQSKINGSFIYASWVRECQVYLSRKGVLVKSQERNGQIISRTLDMINEHPILMPYDVPITREEAEKHDGLSTFDNGLLDALCSFDFLYCICVFVAGQGEGYAYPAFTDFSPNRIKAIDAIMFGLDDEARRSLLPGYTDEEIALRLKYFLDLLQIEVMNSSTYFWGFNSIPNLNAFIDKYTNSSM